MKTTTTLKSIFTAIVGIGLVALLAAPAGAALIQVDIEGTQDQYLYGGTNTTQTGWESWDTQAHNHTSRVKEFAYSSTTAGTLKVTISSTGSTMYQRSQGFTNLGSTEEAKLTYRDVWNEQLYGNKLVNNEYLEIKLENLLAGEYSFSSYHYSDINTLADGSALVSVNGTSTGVTQKYLTQQTSKTAADIETDGIFTTNFTVAADGDLVSIRYTINHGTSERHFGINGFEIAIPEPTTALLLLLGGCSLMFRRRRRCA